MGETSVGAFFGLSLTVGMVATGLTQIVKVTQSIPGLSKLPPVQWLLRSINSGNVMSNRVFVAVICLALSALSAYLKNGVLPSFTDPTYYLFSFKAFLDATAGYKLLLERTNPQ